MKDKIILELNVREAFYKDYVKLNELYYVEKNEFLSNIKTNFRKNEKLHFLFPMFDSFNQYEKCKSDFRDIENIECEYHLDITEDKITFSLKKENYDFTGYEILPHFQLSSTPLTFSHKVPFVITSLSKFELVIVRKNSCEIIPKSDEYCYIPVQSKYKIENMFGNDYIKIKENTYISLYAFRHGGISEKNSEVTFIYNNVQKKLFDKNRVVKFCTFNANIEFYHDTIENNIFISAVVSEEDDYIKGVYDLKINLFEPENYNHYIKDGNNFYFHTAMNLRFSMEKRIKDEETYILGLSEDFIEEHEMISKINNFTNYKIDFGKYMRKFKDVTSVELKEAIKEEVLINFGKYDFIILPSNLEILTHMKQSKIFALNINSNIGKIEKSKNYALESLFLKIYDIDKIIDEYTNAKIFTKVFFNSII